MKKIIILFCLAFEFSNFAFAEQNRLYKNYYSGMSKAELRQNSKIYDCNDVNDDSISYCIDDQDFLGFPAEIGFGFLNDKLFSTTLYIESTTSITESYAKILSALARKFSLVSISNEDAQFDLLEENKGNLNGIDKNELRKFETQALNDGYITYTFFDSKNSKEVIKLFNSVDELLAKAPKNSRIVEYELAETEDREKVISTLQFYDVNFARSILKNYAKETEKEDF